MKEKKGRTFDIRGGVAVLSMNIFVIRIDKNLY